MFLSWFQHYLLMSLSTFPLRKDLDYRTYFSFNNIKYRTNQNLFTWTEHLEQDVFYFFFIGYLNDWMIHVSLSVVWKTNQTNDIFLLLFEYSYRVFASKILLLKYWHTFSDFFQSPVGKGSKLTLDFHTGDPRWIFGLSLLQ